MAKAPTIGELRHYITIQQPVIAVDEYGQTVRTWQNVEIRLPAKITVKNHSNREAGDKNVSWTETIFTVRARTTFYDTYRIVYDGRYYSIHSIADVDGTRKWMEIRTVNQGDLAGDAV